MSDNDDERLSVFPAKHHFHRYPGGDSEGEEKKEDDSNEMNWCSDGGNNVVSIHACSDLAAAAAATTTTTTNAFEFVHKDNGNDEDYKSSKNIAAHPKETQQLIQQLPLDVIREICGMVSDPVTFCRLAMTCRSFRQCVDHIAPRMWKYYYQQRWTRAAACVIADAAAAVNEDDASMTMPSTATTMTMTTTPTTVLSTGHDDDESNYNHNHNTTTITKNAYPFVNWKILYQQRHVQDVSIVELVQKVVTTELAPQRYDFTLLLQRPGMLASTQVEDVTWKQALAKAGGNIMDVLCAIANQETAFPGINKMPNDNNNNNNNNNELTMITIPDDQQLQQQQHHKLQRFLAASIVFTLHCHEVVTQVASIWEQIVLIRHSAPVMRPPQHHHPHPHSNNRALSFSHSTPMSSCYEDMAVLLAHALRPVPELLQRTSSIQQLRSQVSQHLDALALTVQHSALEHRTISNSTGLQQHATFRPTQNAELDMLETIHHVMWSTSGFGLRARYPETREAAEAACSIQRVVQWKKHQHHVQSNIDAVATTTTTLTTTTATTQNETKTEDCCYRWCHPVLIAIFYQAVARRLDLPLDILFCPQHCFPMLRYYDRATNTLWFLDVMDSPGRILSLRECQDLVERLGLTCEDHSDAPHHPVHHHNPLHHAHARDTFWGQTPMEVTSVLYWLVAPLLLNRRRQQRGRGDSHIGGSDDADSSSDDNDAAALEDQPHNFLLGQLVEGNGGSLMKFLNERLVFFTAILRFCELIHE